MAITVSPVRWAAGLGVVVALGGAALAARPAGAQQPPSVTPAHGGAVFVACLPPGAGALSPPAPGAVAGVRLDTGRFAEELAGALGKTKQEVERALARVERELPPPDEIAVVGHVVGPAHSDGLGSVAARLGVSAEELLEAMQAAAPPCPTAAPRAGPTMASRVEPTQLFAAIAARLGRGITGEQVREAFEANQPTADAPQMIAIRVDTVASLEALADALDVTVEELRAALESIARQRQG